jgi:glycosyltransferase involved in cell wall biosynthesis
LGVVIATVPSFSALIAGVIISRITDAHLIIDYRDPWTNRPMRFPWPFGKRLSVLAERTAIKRASAAVFCTDMMHTEFLEAFGDIAPARRAVIHNGFSCFETAPRSSAAGQVANMIFAGNLRRSRRLLAIAPVLGQMLAAGEISPTTFRFHIYTERAARERTMLKQLGLEAVIETHEPVSYEAIKQIMLSADILFLPSGDDVRYAVPFKFFDYLSVRRPILAVAPQESGVAQLMRSVDCGEFADSGNPEQIRQKLVRLLRRERSYTFEGADRFLWENAAREYLTVIDDVVKVGQTGQLAPRGWSSRVQELS